LELNVGWVSGSVTHPIDALLTSMRYVALTHPTNN